MNAIDSKAQLENESSLQLDANGKLRHLLTLKGLDKALLTEILDDAENFLTPPGSLPARSEALAGRTVANLFFEPSTRTRASFDLAGKRLGADVLNLDVNTMNRGIEIEGTLADGPNSVITQQVTNGVAVRMAVLNRVTQTMASH